LLALVALVIVRAVAEFSEILVPRTGHVVLIALRILQKTCGVACHRYVWEEKVILGLWKSLKQPFASAWQHPVELSFVSSSALICRVNCTCRRLQPRNHIISPEQSLGAHIIRHSRNKLHNRSLRSIFICCGSKLHCILQISGRRFGSWMILPAEEYHTAKLTVYHAISRTRSDNRRPGHGVKPTRQSA
jgi:hypothetical protein